MTVLLAQVNVMRLRADAGCCEVAGLAAAMAAVHQLGESAPGFVWRLPAAESHAFATPAGGDGRDIVNLSVWCSYEALHAFVYRSAHGALLRRRAMWFEPVEQPSTALWWIDAGHESTLDEGVAQLARLRHRGPSPAAFGLRRRFDPAGRPVARRHHR